jgi:hypothetical protein
MSKIQNSRDLTFDLDRYYDIFEISNQKDLFTKSKFGEFEQKLIEAILKNKEEILFKKPISMVEGCCIQKLQEMEKELLLREETVKNCSLSDDDLENKKTQLERAIKRINKKIDGFGFDIEDSINENVRRAENEIKDEIDSTINKLNRYVNESVGLMTSGNEVVRTFKDRIFSLEVRNCKTLSLFGRSSSNKRIAPIIASSLFKLLFSTIFHTKRIHCSNCSSLNISLYSK